MEISLYIAYEIVLVNQNYDGVRCQKIGTHACMGTLGGVIFLELPFLLNYK